MTLFSFLLAGSAAVTATFADNSLPFFKRSSYSSERPSFPTHNVFSTDEASVTSDWTTTVPYYPHYPTRTVQVLDGNWYFGYGGSNWNLSQLTYSTSERTSLTPNVTIVPSAFDIEMPGILGPRGTAFYRANVNIPSNHKVYVYFSACSFYCQLYVDGEYIGDHAAGGYQPFGFDVPASSNSSSRELFVVVDNRINNITAPTYTGGDFYAYGGITRNVLVHTLPLEADTSDDNYNYLRRVEVFPYDIDDGLVNLRIVFANKFSSNQVQKFNFVFDNDTQNAQETEELGEMNRDDVLFNGVAVPNFKVWSLSSPNLHTLTVEYLDANGTAFDAITVRFGMRIFGKKKYPGSNFTRLTVNNEIVKLHGNDRHTMWPDTGSALTYEQIKSDLKVILDLGINYIRGSHYPQDQRFLDLCDENGVFVWSETLGPKTSVSDYENEYWMQHQIQAVNEMVDASINNPSVIFWAFYNEGPSNDAAACPGYNKSASALRARDYTRYITWASNKRTEDVCIGDIADVASFNGYPAWYETYGDPSYCKEFWSGNAMNATLKWPDKPFFISETGASGVYEYQNTTAVQWSQLYQSEVVRSDITVALNDSRISGVTMWQFSDIKANDDDTTLCGQCDYYPNSTLCAYINVNCTRPGGENHKGVIDFWRRTKIAYNVTKQLYTSYSE